MRGTHVECGNPPHRYHASEWQAIKPGRPFWPLVPWAPLAPGGPCMPGGPLETETSGQIQAQSHTRSLPGHKMRRNVRVMFSSPGERQIKRKKQNACGVLCLADLYEGRAYIGPCPPLAPGGPCIVRHCMVILCKW